MLRRRPPEPAPAAPAHPWQPRVDAARSLIDRSGAPGWVGARVDDLQRRLMEAEDDRRRLADAVAGLDPERATQELKDGLRRAERGSIDPSVVEALRRRHETVHHLMNRHDDLGARIDGAVADLEGLAARVVVASTDGGSFDAELNRLSADLDALAAAHDELRDL